jgi:oligopeptide transport system substrate-binding protein
VLLRLLSNDGVALPGAQSAPTAEVLTQGAQVAAQGPPTTEAWSPPGGASYAPAGPPSDDPPAMWPPPGPHTPPPGPYHLSGPDTPPPGGTHRMTDPYGQPPRKSRPGVVAAAAAALVLLTAIGVYAGVKLGSSNKPNPTPSPVVAGKSGGTFRMALYAPDYLEPSNALTTADFFVVENLYTGLSTVRPDGTVARALATQVTANPTCTQWQFTIKPGTTFSNGEPVDATSFARSWNRTVDNNSGGEGYLMNDFQGYTDVLSGRSSAMSGVVATGDRLQVTLTQPDCDFEKRVAAPVFAPMPSVAGSATNTAYNQQPIGNGPFKIGSYTPHSSLTLVRNDSYAFAKPKLDSVQMTFQTDLSAALSGFDARQYDWAELASSSIPTAIARHTSDGQLVKGAIGGMTYILPIDDKGPMKTKEARLAVSYALDRKALVSSAYQGIYPVATSIVPPAVPGASVNGCTACVNDPAKAKTLAGQAGLGPGAKVTMTLGDTSSYTALASVVQAQLKSVLGWDVTLRKLPISKFYPDEASQGAQGMYPFSWVADYPSPVNFLDSLLSTGSIQRRNDGSVGGSNYARYSNPAFDSAIKAARATSDATQRIQREQAAEKIAMDDMALIPLYSHISYRVVNTKVFTNVGLDYIGYPVLTTTAQK